MSKSLLVLAFLFTLPAYAESPFDVSAQVKDMPARVCVRRLLPELLENLGMAKKEAIRASDVRKSYLRGFKFNLLLDDGSRYSGFIDVKVSKDRATQIRTCSLLRESCPQLERVLRVSRILPEPKEDLIVLDAPEIGGGNCDWDSRIGG